MTFPSPLSILAGLIFGAGIALLAYRARALSQSGAIAAALLGWIVFGLGGWDYTVVLMAFFISSSGLSFAFKRRKQGLDEKHAKGNRRDAGQVAANGGIAGLMVLIHTLLPQADWVWWAYCASLAAANADTWATELGVLSPVKPRLIISGKEVEMGTSGGVTPSGTLASFSGALLIAACGWVFHPQSFSAPMLVALAGLGGSLVDSVLGATIQAVYYCPTCRKETERHPSHTCGSMTKQIRGLTWLDNDWVNGACTLSGALITIVLLAGAGWL